MEKMNITAAKYVDPYDDGEHSGIHATIDGRKLFVPIAEGNRHYKAILAWVEEGNTIEAAE